MNSFLYQRNPLRMKLSLGMMGKYNINFNPFTSVYFYLVVMCYLELVMSNQTYKKQLRLRIASIMEVQQNQKMWSEKILKMPSRKAIKD